MANIDEEMVRNRLLILKDNLDFLYQKRNKISLENLSNDLTLQYSVLYLLQNSVQILIDVSNHILARKTHSVPAEAGNIFDVLVNEKIISMEHSKKFKQMVKFRNLLIHRYQNIDIKEIHRILKENLGDFELFIEDVKKTLKPESGDATK